MNNSGFLFTFIHDSDVSSCNLYASAANDQERSYYLYKTVKKTGVGVVYFRLDNLYPNVTYYFRVTATDDSGNETNLSDTQVISVLTSGNIIQAKYVKLSMDGANMESIVKDPKDKVNIDFANGGIDAKSYTRSNINVVDNAILSGYTFNEDSTIHSKMPLIKNKEYDNTLNSSDGSPITIMAIDTVNHYITLNSLPDIDTIITPVAGEEWVLLNLDTATGSDPGYSGRDYQDGVLVLSASRANKRITYSVNNMQGDISDWSIGDKVAFYNPFIDGSGWEFYGSIIDNTKITNSTYVTSGGVFKKADGNYGMFVNARINSIYSVYIFTSSDLVTWAIDNSSTAVFEASGSIGSWYKDQVFSSGNVLDLPWLDMKIAYLSGYNSDDGKWRIGNVIFKDDFSEITYSDAEIIDSSGSTLGLYSSSVVRHRGKYVMVYTDRNDGSLTTYPWRVREARCSNPFGPYINVAVICEGLSTNDGVYWSSHCDANTTFIYKGDLYAMVMGTARYKYAGNVGNRVIGLWVYDNGSWVELNNNPFLINQMYGNYHWAGSIGTDHMGGYPCYIVDKENGYIYFFTSVTSSSDSYEISCWRLNLKEALP